MKKKNTPSAKTAGFVRPTTGRVKNTSSRTSSTKSQKKIFKGGAIVERDPRNLMLGAVQQYVDIPEEYYLTLDIKRHFQGNQPACGAYAGVHLKEVQEFIETGKHIGFNPRFTWIKIKQHDGFPISIGTSLEGIFRSLKNYGAYSGNMLANNIKLSLDDYANNSSITKEMEDESEKFIIKNYGFTYDPDFEEVRQRIYQNKVAILLLKGDDGFWSNNYPTFSKKKWGHFVAALGYDKDHIIVIDSAEENNKYGIKLIHKKYFPNFCVAIGTCVDAPNWQVEVWKQQIPILRQMVVLYTKLIALIKNG